MLTTLLRQKRTRHEIRAAEHQLPLIQGIDQLLQGRAGFFREWATRRDANDPYWAPMQLGEALDRVQVPILLQNGWQDLFLEQTFEQFEHLRNRGITVGLTVGPWNHEEIVTRGKDIPIRETLDWLEEHLVGTGAGTRAKPIRIHVNGAEQWREFAQWPPKTTGHARYLAGCWGLSALMAAANRDSPIHRRTRRPRSAVVA